MKGAVAPILYVILTFVAIITFAIYSVSHRVTKLERIVGTEPPATMNYTNGHTYTTLVKHSANCPCVKEAK